MKLTIVEKNLLSWTAMHIDFAKIVWTVFEKFERSGEKSTIAYFFPTPKKV